MMILNTKRYLPFSLLLFFLLLLLSIPFLSCASAIQSEVLANDNPTIQMLKIREQTFLRRYKLSEKLYKQVQANHRENTSLQVEIDYEIAFLYVKQEKYKEAKLLFETIINQYELDANSQDLPQWPYYLSQKILVDVVEKELIKPPIWHSLIPRRWRPIPKTATASL